MTSLVIAVIALTVIVLVLVAVSRSRRSSDGVDSFRRQIDALSPEARRPVIDQMYNSPERNEPRIEPRIDPRPADAEGAGSADESADDDDTGRDGAHGA